MKERLDMTISFQIQTTSEYGNLATRHSVMLWMLFQSILGANVIQDSSLCRPVILIQEVSELGHIPFRVVMASDRPSHLAQRCYLETLLHDSLVEYGRQARYDQDALDVFVKPRTKVIFNVNLN